MTILHDSTWKHIYKKTTHIFEEGRLDLLNAAFDNSLSL